VRRHAALAWIAFTVALAPRPVLCAEPEDTSASAEYRQIVERAVDAHRAGRWQEARALLERAHALSPSARTSRALGMTLFELGDVVAAYRALSEALTDTRRPLSDEHRAQVAELRDRAAMQIGRITVAADAPAVDVDLDGRRAALEPDSILLVPAGAHEITVRAQGRAPFVAKVEIAGGEAQRLEARFEPLAPEKPVATPVSSAKPAVVPKPRSAVATAPPPRETKPRFWTWVAAGATGVFGATALGFGLAGKAEYTELQAQCAGGCIHGDAANDPDLSTLRFYEGGTNVALALAGAAAATTVVLFFVEGGSREAKVAVAAGPRGLSVTGRY
jgi:hypothetical protein